MFTLQYKDGNKCNIGGYPPKGGARTVTVREREEYENFEAWLCTLNSFSPSELRFGFLAWQAAKQSPISQNEQQEPLCYLAFYSYDDNGEIVEGFEEVNKYADKAFPVFTSPPKQAIPDGWKLVPIEPTDEMKELGWNAYRDSNKPAPYNALTDAYKAMLNAAPTNTEVGE